MTLLGHDFGVRSTNHVVLVDSVPVPTASVLLYNHTHIVFAMTPGLGSRRISVSVAGQEPVVQPERAMRFFPPTLSALTPNTAGTDGGSEVGLQSCHRSCSRLDPPLLLRNLAPFLDGERWPPQ